MAITLFLEIWSHYIEQLSLTSYVDQVGLHLWQSLAFTFQVPGLQPVFLYTVMAFTKTFSFNCITILTIFTSSNILLSPQTHQCSPPSLASTSMLCVCVLGLSPFSQPPSSLSPQSWLALKLHNLSVSASWNYVTLGLITS